MKYKVTMTTVFEPDEADTETNESTYDALLSALLDNREGGDTITGDGSAITVVQCRDCEA